MLTAAGDAMVCLTLLESSAPNTRFPVLLMNSCRSVVSGAEVVLLSPQPMSLPPVARVLNQTSSVYWVGAVRDVAVVM